MTNLRSKFLKESVNDLRLNLEKYGSRLYTFIGKPEEIIPDLI